jgi:hypothetical protein
MARATYRRQWLQRRLRQWMKRQLYSRLYRDDDRDTGKSIMVAGAGRSGTTWVAELISSQAPARILFEPFHCGLVSDYSTFNYFQYMRPEDESDELYAYCQRVFSGAIRHPWIDRAVDTLNPQIRVVKDIRANLFLKWIKRRFPDVPLLFVIRHPCAVVQSRMQLGWATDGDIGPFLSQPALVEDHLSDKLDVIKGALTPEEKHAVIWCISNLIPLRQFSSGELTVHFYERLCVEPEVEVRRIFEAIGRAFQPSILGMVGRPSSTTKPSSAVMRGGDRVTGWRDRLAPQQVEDILAIVRAFGLDYLYSDGSMPLVEANGVFRRQPAEAPHG